MFVIFFFSLSRTFKTMAYWNIVILQCSISFYSAAAKSLQSCSTLCNPIDSSPPGSPIPGILFKIQLKIKGMFPISYSLMSKSWSSEDSSSPRTFSESGFRMRKKSTVPTRLITVRAINTVLRSLSREKNEDESRQHQPHKQFQSQYHVQYFVYNYLHTLSLILFYCISKNLGQRDKQDTSTCLSVREILISQKKNSIRT